MIKTILILLLPILSYSQVFVEDGNDPRAKAYLDSLNLYNFGEWQLKLAQQTERRNTVEGRKYMDKLNAAYSKLNQHIKPIGFNSTFMVLYKETWYSKTYWRPDIYMLPREKVFIRKQINKPVQNKVVVSSKKIKPVKAITKDKSVSDTLMVFEQTPDTTEYIMTPYGERVRKVDFNKQYGNQPTKKYYPVKSTN